MKNALNCARTAECASNAPSSARFVKVSALAARKFAVTAECANSAPSSVRTAVKPAISAAICAITAARAPVASTAAAYVTHIAAIAPKWESLNFVTTVGITAVTA